MQVHLLEDRFEGVTVRGPVPPPPPGATWEGLMERALGLAARAEAEGEVPVGALVVDRSGLVVGEGRNGPVSRADPTAHAEILALREAASRAGNYRLEGCVLVATLEPCAMCAAACAHARIDGLVYGACDRRAGCVGSMQDLLDWPFLNHRVWHMGGVLGEECAERLRRFFAARR